jgi:predicted nucleic acid-binding protein
MSVNVSPQFLDTNILVYAYDTSAGEKHVESVRLVNELWDCHNGCVSIQVLQEFYVCVSKKAPHTIDVKQASQIIEDLNAWKVHSPEVRDVIGAIGLQQRFCLSFWDAMIVQSALQTNCEILWSEDFSDGQVLDGVKIRNPFLHFK